MRNRYGALFLEDSWRVRPNLTFNYGFRWDVEMPFHEKFNQIQTLVAGEQSLVYPGAPTGLVFPGDPGISRSLGKHAVEQLVSALGLGLFARRQHSGVLGSCWQSGRFQHSFGAGVSSRQWKASPPSHGGRRSVWQHVREPASPLFSNPFVDAGTGFNEGQRFPLSFPAFGASPSHPNTTVDWTPFLPISGLPGYAPGNVSPYATHIIFPAAAIGPRYRAQPELHRQRGPSSASCSSKPILASRRLA